MRGKKLLSLLLSTTLIGTMLPTAALATVDSGADSSPPSVPQTRGCGRESRGKHIGVYSANTKGDKTTPAGEDNNDAIPSGFRKPLTLL